MKAEVKPAGKILHPFLAEVMAKHQADPDHEEQITRKQEAEREEAERAWLNTVPLLYRHESFDTYKCSTETQRKIIEYLRSYQGEQNVILHGNKGTGKTHLLWSFVKTTKKRVRYMTQSALLRRVKTCFSTMAKESEQDVLDELESVPVLILDEIGRQNGTVFESNFMFDLINQRYNNRLPVVLGSNLNIQEADPALPSITFYVGEAAMDRIQANVMDIPCTWANYRHRHKGKSGQRDEPHDQ